MFGSSHSRSRLDHSTRQEPAPTGTSESMKTSKSQGSDGGRRSADEVDMAPLFVAASSLLPPPNELAESASSDSDADAPDTGSSASPDGARR